MNRKIKIDHPAVSSRTFELKTTVEFDVTIGDSHVPTRLEVFESVERDGHFRCLFWERESMELTPSFPVDESGKPEHTSSDPVMVERPHMLREEYSDFQADSVEDAVLTVMEDFLSRLEHMTEKDGFITNE